MYSAALNQVVDQGRGGRQRKQAEQHTQGDAR